MAIPKKGPDADAVMEQQGLTQALAYDRDFEQAGFVALLRTP